MLHTTNILVNFLSTKMIIVLSLIFFLFIRRKRSQKMAAKQPVSQSSAKSDDHVNTHVSYTVDASTPSEDPAITYSDDEPDIDDPHNDFTYIVTWRDAKNYKLRFGKYKGQSLAVMITKRKKREYLRYLSNWKELRPSTKSHIDAALLHYKHLNDLYQKIKQG